jgi:alanine dehydrogenase
MRIGVPREVKPGEGRVSLLPEQVEVLVKAGHAVQVERGAGAASGIADVDYSRVGAALAENGQWIFQISDLIVKVKEIMPEEYAFLRPEHILFTNLHCAVLREQLDKLLEVGLTAIAAEETHATGSPNSALAGEVGAFEGLRLAFAPHGGPGRHFFERYGASPVRALVIGLGNVGQGALRTLLGLGVSVAGFDVSPEAREKASREWREAGFSAHDISELPDHLAAADVIYNCVLWPKTRGDHLIDRAALKALKPTSVVVDISCDPAGAIETSRATTWADPVYVEEGIRHFCVDNIPGAVPATASAGYGRSIIDHVEMIAEVGALAACRQNDWIARGLTCTGGELVLAEAAAVQARPFTPVAEVLAR